MLFILTFSKSKVMYKFCKFFFFIKILLCATSAAVDTIVPRIAGGKPAASNQFPHQISLQTIENGYRHICGGSIITPGAVLTAAHCVTTKGTKMPVAKRTFRVFAGTISLSKSRSTVVKRTLKQIIIHPNYLDIKHDFDFAILIVNGQYSFATASIQPIALENSTTIDKDVPCLVSGWGRNGSGHLPTILHYAEVNVWDLNKCKKSYEIPLTERMICALGNKLEGSRKGDSGGPLTCNGFLVGVVSFGVPKNESIPAVYSFVPSVFEWIKTNGTSKQMCISLTLKYLLILILLKIF